MASENVPEEVPPNIKLQFDLLVSNIEQKFSKLFEHLRRRRDALIQKIKLILEDYENKESTRRESLQELEKAQLQLKQISLKSNVNIHVHEQAELAYQKGKEELVTPTKTPNLRFSCTNFSLLTAQIDQFGSLDELKTLHERFSQTPEPILTVENIGGVEHEVYPRSLALDEENQTVYVADPCKHRVLVLAFQGDFLTQFGKEFLDHPAGIAVTENVLLVADWKKNALFQFSKKDHQLISQTSEGDVLKLKPIGVRVDTNGDVFLANPGNNNVLVYSDRLQFIRSFGEESLSYPCDMILTTEKVFVLDHGPKSVHFFSRNGDLLRSIISQGGILGRQLLRPHCFCMDAEQNVFISNFGQHNLKIFSNSGELLYTIGKQGSGKGEFDTPFGIALSDAGVLFVVSLNANYPLQCF